MGPGKVIWLQVQILRWIRAVAWLGVRSSLKGRGGAEGGVV